MTSCYFIVLSKNLEKKFSAKRTDMYSKAMSLFYFVPPGPVWGGKGYSLILSGEEKDTLPPQVPCPDRTSTGGAPLPRQDLDRTCPDRTGTGSIPPP